VRARAPGALLASLPLTLTLALGAAPGGEGAPLATAAARGPTGGGARQLILSHGQARAVVNRFLAPAGGPSGEPDFATPGARPGPQAGSAGARASRSPGPTVAGALAGLARSGALSAPASQQYLSEYQSARGALRRLRGTRRNELGAVLANVEAIAAARRFTPTRLPALFLTLQRNQQWWTTGPLLAAGQRVGFPGSRLVWEYYPGQGVEIQWLGTFGEANGYYSARDNGDLRLVLDEAVALASARAHGIAWEYLFRFDGGLPPWTSGLSQGTGIQALTRAWSRLHDASYLTAAQGALGIFQTPPPEGVRVATAAGAHYLEYSYAPRERILNGFIQSLVGLYDFTRMTRDPLGEQLFEAGDAAARAETPTYDTGAWSLYDQAGESDLSYHELVTQFLDNLCSRTQQTPTPRSSAPGGSRPNPDQVYCSTAQRFRDYLKTPPALSLLTSRLAGGRNATLRYRLSKISTVTVSVRHGAALVFARRALVGHGLRGTSWTTPARAGAYTLTISATDLAGNGASVQGALAVSAASGVKPR
jgi:D-glucuronyl C5-epimerase-like protein